VRVNAVPDGVHVTEREYAIEECLRYQSPFTMATLRFTTEPVELDDVTIPSGAPLARAEAEIALSRRVSMASRGLRRCP
jgi:cytochrome P450